MFSCLSGPKTHVVIFLDLCKNGLTKEAIDLFRYGSIPRKLIHKLLQDQIRKANSSEDVNNEKGQKDGSDSEKAKIINNSQVPIEKVSDINSSTRFERPDKEKIEMLKAKDRLEQRTCLHIAAYYGHEEIVEFLCVEFKKFSLSVDPLDHLDFTPLLYACYRCYDQLESEALLSRIRTVKCLVQTGADINYAKTGTLLTPLHWAAFNNDKEVVQYLIDQGAKMTHSKGGQMPLGVAGLCDNFEVVECILDNWWRDEQRHLSSSKGCGELDNNTIVNRGSSSQLGTPPEKSKTQIVPANVAQSGVDQALADLEGTHSMEIKLKYDTNQDALKGEHALTFKILYWAALLGKNVIVDHIIKQGYSPFVQCQDKQNAVIAAVEGAQKDTLELILNYNYIPANPKIYLKTRDARDKNGNTAMHHACMLQMREEKEDIVNVLRIHKLDTNERNYRGLLPEDMNHKLGEALNFTKGGNSKLNQVLGGLVKKHAVVDDPSKNPNIQSPASHNEEEDSPLYDREPDYVFVVQQYGVPFLAAQFVNLKLLVKEFKSAKNPDHAVLVVYFADDVLDQVAEINQVQCRLLNQKATLPFKQYAIELYEQFQARQKQFLMLQVFKEEIDIKYFEKVGVIVEHFPLHDNFRMQIDQSWIRYRTRLFFGLLTGNFKEYMQPLNFIANYYGEKMAFYFAFLSFYTSWLLIPAIPGFILFIYQLVLIGTQYRDGETVSIDTPYACLYCLVMAVWSTVLVEIWKRRQNEIAHLWNMQFLSKDGSERPDFKADLVIDTDLRTVRRMNTVNTYIRRLFGEIPIVSISIGIVVGCFVGMIIYQRLNKEESAMSVGASILNAMIIIVLDFIYKKIALIMVTWENHKYAEDWENSLVTKNFSFTFVNSNIALFATAFADQSFNILAQNLAIILAVKQLASAALDILVPHFTVKFKKWRLSKLFERGFEGKATNEEDLKLQQEVEEQLILEADDGVMVMRYSDIFIKMGYIMFFAQAFPIAPLLSIFANFLEMRATINGLSYYSKRFVALPSSGIGGWLNICELLSLVSVAVNCAIIFYTSNALNSVLIKSEQESSLYKFMIVVLIEHVIIIFKYVLSSVINDKPGWVVKEEREIMENQDELYEMLESKKAEYKNVKGRILLEDQIRDIKKKQKRIAQNLQKKIDQQVSLTMGSTISANPKLAALKRQKKLAAQQKVTLYEIFKARDQRKQRQMQQNSKLVSPSGGNNKPKNSPGDSNKPKKGNTYIAESPTRVPIDNTGEDASILTKDGMSIQQHAAGGASLKWNLAKHNKLSPDMINDSQKKGMAKVNKKETIAQLQQSDDEDDDEEMEAVFSDLHKLIAGDLVKNKDMKLQMTLARLQSLASAETNVATYKSIQDVKAANNFQNLAAQGSLIQKKSAGLINDWKALVKQASKEEKNMNQSRTSNHNQSVMHEESKHKEQNVSQHSIRRDTSQEPMNQRSTHRNQLHTLTDEPLNKGNTHSSDKNDSLLPILNKKEAVHIAAEIIP